MGNETVRYTHNNSTGFYLFQSLTGADLKKYSWGGKRVAGDFEGWHPVAEVYTVCRFRGGGRAGGYFLAAFTCSRTFETRSRKMSCES